MSQYISGDVVKNDELDRLPIGTVAKQGYTGARLRVKVSPTEWYRTESGETRVPGPSAYYTLKYVPDTNDFPAPKPVLSERDQLARKLRATFLAHPTPDEVTVTPMWQDVADVATAHFAVEKADLQKVTDSSGTVWTLRDNGKYSIADSKGWKTRDGIKTVTPW